MNKEMKDKLYEIREHVYEAYSLYTDMLLSDDYYSISVEDMKTLGVASRHLSRCSDRLHELYHRNE